MDYVKPHGALYNDMMENEEIFEAIVKAIKDYNPALKIMGLSGKNQKMIKAITTKYKIDFYNEVFLDRAYNDDASLVSRKEPYALISAEMMVQRVSDLLEGKPLQSINGKALDIPVDCLCVHTDNKASLEVLKTIKDMINEHQGRRGE